MHTSGTQRTKRREAVCVCACAGEGENEGHKEDSNAQQLYQYHLSARSSSAHIRKHRDAPTSAGYCTPVPSTK